ncbi:sialic acid TRAP transporter substrate-binding protein SiaP [Bosea thiooxidans]|nr:sialic acid TRAP transporter substrate-binding protein SiaP [Bosea sp. (in: a-proteobacteria)]
MKRQTRREFLAATAAGAAAIAAPNILRAEQLVLRWADGQPATHPSPQSAVKAGAEIKEKTSGRIEIQSFPNGQLGSSRDMVESVASGALTMVTEGAAQLGQFVPQLSIIEAPYIWKDAAHMTRALKSPLMDELNKALVEKRGMRMIGVNYYGVRHVTSGKKPINSVEDMKGFKLRVPEVDTFRAMAEAWGARPTPLNFSELYLALSQGAVDGQENPLPTIASAKLAEVQKYLVLTAHIITPRLVIVNETAWKKIPQADRDVIVAAVDKAATWQDNEILEQEKGLADSLGKAGMTVTTPDNEAFRKPVLASVPGKFESKWGKGLWDRIQAL